MITPERLAERLAEQRKRLRWLTLAEVEPAARHVFDDAPEGEVRSGLLLGWARTLHLYGYEEAAKAAVVEAAQNLPQGTPTHEHLLEQMARWGMSPARRTLIDVLASLAPALLAGP